jgi:phosphoglycolate phosphatase
MSEILSFLEDRGTPWGIVTNKPAWLTDPLIEAMQLQHRAGAVVSGDTCQHRKPHPEPILHACTRLRQPAARSWYIGDAGRDIEAGRAAGCLTVAALYGYLYQDDPPDAWDSDIEVDSPAQLLKLLHDCYANPQSR